MRTVRVFRMLFEGLSALLLLISLEIQFEYKEYGQYMNEITLSIIAGVMLLNYILFIYVIKSTMNPLETISQKSSLKVISNGFKIFTYIPIINTSWLWRQFITVKGKLYEPKREDELVVESNKRLWIEWVFAIFMSIILAFFSYIPKSYLPAVQENAIIVFIFILCVACFFHMLFGTLFFFYNVWFLIIIMWIFMPFYFPIKLFYRDYSFPFHPIFMSVITMRAFVFFIKKEICKTNAYTPERNKFSKKGPVCHERNIEPSRTVVK